MPELKLGTKFECYNCGTKFYDLGKSESICPKCGAARLIIHCTEQAAAALAEGADEWADGWADLAARIAVAGLCRAYQADHRRLLR